MITKIVYIGVFFNAGIFMLLALGDLKSNALVYLFILSDLFLLAGLRTMDGRYSETNRRRTEAEAENIRDFDKEFVKQFGEF